VDAQFFLVEARADALGELAAALAAGDLEVAVAQVFPLADGRAAYASRGQLGTPGKAVLDVAQ
jgi:NADPH:quinone reductase-like Zn-dependent oxidoreductase